MRRSRGNEGWGGYRVHFDTGWRRWNEEIESRTVQGVDGGSCSRGDGPDGGGYVVCVLRWSGGGVRPCRRDICGIICGGGCRMGRGRDDSKV